ncbi:MAG: type-F conjugative transfer system secretin TraK [Pseudomonadota bacterium]|nr:type-F conjugative transfer system secretin TraK [Pseudomonadota bacterium]
MKIRSAISPLLLALSAFGYGQAHALQVRDVVDGQSVLVQVSAKEPSRIVVEGQPIRAATADEESLIIHREDKDPQGHIFVRPVDPRRHATLFVSTDTGAYSLLLQPADIPAETVVIRDRSRRAPPKLEQAASRIKAAKSLILTIARDETPSDMDVREHGQDYALWREARFTLDRSWLGQAYIGERWRLSNVSPVRMSVLEQEFYKDGVVAIAVEHHNIEPGQATNVFVVREKKADE